LIDIRYHIYSLAAVFLALAVGIVVGTSFARSTPSDSAGRQTILRYENDMHVLKDEISKAHDDAASKDAVVKACQDYCKTVMPAVIKNRLLWRNVAIIQTGDYDDLTGTVKQALELSGAHVISTTEISRDFPFDDNSKIAEILVNSGLGTGSDGKQSRDKLFRVLAASVCSAKYANLVSRLEDAGIATFTGDYGKQCKLVVLVGGSSGDESNTADTVDAQLISQMDKLGITIVGCETSNAGSSYVTTWHKMAIASVDNAESAMGQTALICALNGEVASFGTKPTADRLIPKTLESQ